MNKYDEYGFYLFDAEVNQRDLVRPKCQLCDYLFAIIYSTKKEDVPHY